MSDQDFSPLSAACVRGLCDKLYEKRKYAGVEIEKMVRDFSGTNKVNQIKKLLRVLGHDLMSKTNPNYKNGALMGLSSVAVGLGKECSKYLPELLKPILACMSETESRIRYQATESLYNVAKMARGGILDHFAEVFDALGRLVTDPEPQVKQGAELLDRLIKDIVTEQSTFDMTVFVPLLRERIYTRNPFGRQFIISWVSVLDSIPDINLIVHLPEILDGLFKILDDVTPEIKRMCDVQLNEFLRRIRKDPSDADFPAMINILAIHAQSNDDTLQFTAITWIKEFVSLSGGAMLPYMSGILIAVLPCLAYNDEARKNIKDVASVVNFQLMELVSQMGTDKGDQFKQTMPSGDIPGEKETTLEETKEMASSSGDGAEEKDGEKGIDLPSVVEVLSQLLHHNSVHTKVAVLKWILHLYNKMPSEMHTHTDKLFLSLVGSLTDSSDDVVRQSLAVLAEVCSGPTRKDSIEIESSPYYHKFLTSLLRLLSSDESLLEDRGAFIIRQLCVLLNAEDIYKALSKILLSERNLKFVATMVDVLNTILLTSAELFDLRKQLKEFNDEPTRALFVGLHACWCHSPVSLFALSLLTHNYAHCRRLVRLFGDLEITVDFLTEIDKLVQLLESPVLAYVRLEMLEPERQQLRDALYGILMLLPQSDAFHTLRNRLQCAFLVANNSSVRHTETQENTDINFDQLIDTFLQIQEAHRIYKLADRTKNFSLLDR